jgi:hypothetical protein
VVGPDSTRPESNAYRARVPAAGGKHFDVVWADESTTAVCIHVWEQAAAEFALRTVALLAHGREFRFKVRACAECNELPLGDHA